ncbi:hypothetical protein QBC35DRAFT_504349 [Podospora australis]|uniref:FAD-binding PCMH-type domain-containing protein n=1 Tax=Podospora australis TaxID=1536484 RepID=A0AAN7AE27_9PEZI|nr:hypothetical protein QBC35DRAFT_504349 [Podospora australis]
MRRNFIFTILTFGDAFVSFGSTASIYPRPRTEIPESTLTAACSKAKQRLGDARVNTRPIQTPELVQQNWSQACWKVPYCIILPSTAEEVSESLKIIKSFRVPFAIRAGGHSPNPEWSSIDGGGILLDLQQINVVTVAGDGSSVSVGAGARWGSVYDALESKNRAVIGARDRSVGVGGSILGGGYHHLSNQFALAADNVKNFEVVLSNGTIANANVKQNSDLFWALKGGGPNFGVVTRYDLYALPVSTIWAQINVYAPAQVPALIIAFDDWQVNGPVSDVKGNADLIISLDFAVLILVYSEPVSKPSKIFDPFFALEPIATALPAANLTLKQLSDIVESASSTAPARHDYRAFSSLVDTELTLEMYDFWLKQANDARDATGITQSFVLQHVSRNLIGVGEQRGGNALSLPDKSQQWWTTIVDWESAKDDAVARSVAIGTTSQWQKRAVERGVDVPVLFMNDASRDQNPLASYGRESLQRLRAVSQRYDEAQIFQHLQRGGFKLSKA